jgi:predicted outer membrane repeat protein
MTRKLPAWFALGIGLASSFSLSAGRAHAGALLRVPLDQPTIGAALAAAAPGDEIRVSTSGSPYVENIILVPGVSLLGGFDDTYTTSDPIANETIVRAAGANTVVGASVGSDVTLAGFTIEGGNTANGGGLFCGPGAALTIADCIIRDNLATTAGGGIQIASGAAPHIVRCTFERNVATLRGGGINVVAGADPTWIEFCTFRSCSTATSGQPAGGGGAISTASGVRFERNLIERNHSGRNGGGMIVNGSASVRAWGNRFYENTCTFDGGAIYASGGSGEHVGTSVERNIAGGSGGGIYFQGGSNRFFDGSLSPWFTSTRLTTLKSAKARTSGWKGSSWTTSRGGSAQAAYSFWWFLSTASTSAGRC